MLSITRHVFLALALYLSLGVTFADTIAGKVVGVTDGDTVTVLDATKTQHKIRLSGIDAPEKAQPFGQRSKENLSNFLFGKQVVVDAGKTDRYGRSVGKVFVGGVDANLEQVSAGCGTNLSTRCAKCGPSSQDSPGFPGESGPGHEPRPLSGTTPRHTQSLPGSPSRARGA